MSGSKAYKLRRNNQCNCNWHQVGKVLLVRSSLLSLICNYFAEALEELAALWQTSVSSVFETLTPESVSLAVQIPPPKKKQTVHISLTALRHFEPSISTSHLIRHHLKVLSYSVCGKVLPKKTARKSSESFWLTDVSILCKTMLVKSRLKRLTARHKLYPQDQSLNGYGMKVSQVGSNMRPCQQENAVASCAKTKTLDSMCSRCLDSI